MTRRPDVTACSPCAMAPASGRWMHGASSCTSHSISPRLTSAPCRIPWPPSSRARRAEKKKNYSSTSMLSSKRHTSFVRRATASLASATPPTAGRNLTRRSSMRRNFAAKRPSRMRIFMRVLRSRRVDCRRRWTKPHGRSTKPKTAQRPLVASSETPIIRSPAPRPM